jgi:hypothetical protein
MTTAYGRMQAEIRRKKSLKQSRGGNAAHAKLIGVTCGAKKRDGGHCSLAAGWGTNHVGIGACKWHGGLLPNHVKAAAKAEYRKLLGNPIEVNPLDAIQRCIHIRAGEVQWLSEKMAELDQKAWIEDTVMGKQFHLFARERSHAMNELVRYSQIAVSLGLTERAVKLAETYGEMIANYTKGIIDALWPHLDEEGRKMWPQVVRRELIRVDSQRQLPPPELEVA